MKKIIMFFALVVLAVCLPVFLISCGDVSSGDSGSVSLYITDSPEDDYTSVDVTINSVQLLHTGQGITCDVFNGTPVTIDITDLSSVLQLLDTSSCESVNYNRIRVVLNEEVELTDTNEITAICSFASYRDEHDNPNVLQCTDSTCSVDINGAVNVLADANNELALDFELRDFEVDNFNLPSCSVTMKVSPLNASGIEEKIEDGYTIRTEL